MRAPEIQLYDDEIIVDSFAGGGGASLGIEMALGRSPDVAINHDAEAIAMHQANHPRTKHYCENVWKVDPKEAVGKKRVGLAWFSPDCKHFSKAKGGKPVEKKIRGLAWVVVRWAQAVRPRVIALENVSEFLTWGPLGPNGRPIKGKIGRTFRAFVNRLKKLGYKVDWRELRACDYGAPTTRKRLFMVARCDGQPIVWPEPTHGESEGSLFALQPYRTAAECILWDVPCPSIFGRKKPLREATERRIARGVKKYVIDAAVPFIVPVTHHGERRGIPVTEPFPTVTGAHRGEQALIAPTLVQTSWGEREGQAPRCLDIQKPIGTMVGGGIKHALVAAFLARHFGGPNGNQVAGAALTQPVPTVTTQDHHGLVTSNLVKLYGTSNAAPSTEPMPTVTAGGNHLAEVRALLIKYYGNERDGHSLADPIGTVTTKDRFGLVTVEGETYAITDLGMRMLLPRELFRAHGFPDSYVIDPIIWKQKKNGKHKRHLSKTAQVRMAGNSVCPPIAAAIIRANLVVREQAVSA